MANEVSNAPVPQDVRHVRLRDAREIEYWTNRFGVSEEQLRAALSDAGDDIDTVAQVLNR